MKKYKLLGGGVIKSQNPVDFVNQLNQLSIFGFRDNINLFMSETAKRCYVDNSVIIRSNCCEDFLEDLIKYKFVEEL